MKVGTDGVLIGAWCKVGSAKRILDIGTGSGVIALMLAQRSAADARVDAVEVSEPDARQAALNFQQSPWPQKVRAVRCDIQIFKPDILYDLIVTNPPFFSKSLISPDTRRTETRHDSLLTQADLLGVLRRLLHPRGTFNLILPPVEAQHFLASAQSAGFALTHRTRLLTRPKKPAERILMSFTIKPSGTVAEDTLILYDSGETKSEAYRRLTDDFYL